VDARVRCPGDVHELRGWPSSTAGWCEPRTFWGRSCSRSSPLGWSRCCGLWSATRSPSALTRPAHRRPGLRRAGRRGSQAERLRPDRSGHGVHDVPADVRHHHAGPHRGGVRGADEVLRLPRVHRVVVARRVRTGSLTGSGAADSWGPASCGSDGSGSTPGAPSAPATLLPTRSSTPNSERPRRCSHG